MVCFNSFFEFINLNITQTFFTAGIAIIIYRTWKKNHVEERKSKLFSEVIHKLYVLRYRILEERQPIQNIPENDVQHMKCINKYRISSFNKIFIESYSIINQLKIIELSELNTTLLTSLCSKIIIKNIIGEIKEHILEFEDDYSSYSEAIGPDDKENKMKKVPKSKLVAFIYPRSGKKNKAKVEQDETGLMYVDDEFYKKLDKNISHMINSLRSHVL